VTLSAAALALLAALRFARRDQPGTALFLITIAGLLLRAWGAGDHFLHAWDERYHALVARHLASHPLVPTLYERALLPYDFRDWRANHVWLHKQPLALWLMAAGIRLFGGTEIAMRIPSVALSTLAIPLTYGIGRSQWGTRVGLLGAAFVAVQGYLLQLPGGRVPVDHVDNALIVCVELAIYCAVRATSPGAPDTDVTGRSSARDGLWLVAAGLATGAALLAKWLPGLLPIPVWLALVIRRKRPLEIAQGLTVLAACAALVALPWQIYIRRSFPLEATWESFYSIRHLFVPVEGLEGSALFYLQRMPRFFGELIYLPVGWFLVCLLRPSQRSSLDHGADTASETQAAAWWGLAVWCFLPYLAFSLAATKLSGYVMVAAPALCLVQACFWLWLWDRRRFARGATLWGRPAAVLGWSVLGLLLVLPLRYTVERLKVRPNYDRDPAWAAALRALPARLGPGPAVLFHLNRPIEAMFYTPYIAYAGIPTPAMATALRTAGYRVVVFDAQGLAPVLGSVPGIELHPEALPQGPLDDGTGFQPRRADRTDSPISGMD
jgi:4-amino-4-deoxy-L-arabinose transferase-like glycosyltransferase